MQIGGDKLEFSRFSLVIFLALAFLSSILYLLLFSFGTKLTGYIYLPLFFITWLSVLFLTIYLILIYLRIWKGKWCLLIFGLIGISKISLNCMTGLVSNNIRSILIVPFQLSYQLIDRELFLTISYPIGVIILLIFAFYNSYKTKNY